MNQPANTVTVHPYFKIKPGKVEEFKSLIPSFLEITRTERLNLYYEFTFNGDVACCREAYLGAEGFLKHLEGVGALLAKALELASLQRLEVHGTEPELALLKPHLAGLNPEWFVYYAGV